MLLLDLGKNIELVDFGLVGKEDILQYLEDLKDIDKRVLGSVLDRYRYIKEQCSRGKSDYYFIVRDGVLIGLFYLYSKNDSSAKANVCICVKKEYSTDIFNPGILNNTLTFYFSLGYRAINIQLILGDIVIRSYGESINEVMCGLGVKTYIRG